MTLCSACGKPEPKEWCWEARLDCPCDKPPKWLSVEDVWGLVRALEKRVAALENPPCCQGGPQWGHAPTCPTLP